MPRRRAAGLVGAWPASPDGTSAASQPSAGPVPRLAQRATSGSARPSKPGSARSVRAYQRPRSCAGGSRRRSGLALSNKPCGYEVECVHAEDLHLEIARPDLGQALELVERVRRCTPDWCCTVPCSRADRPSGYSSPRRFLCVRANAWRRRIIGTRPHRNDMLRAPVRSRTPHQPPRPPPCSADDAPTRPLRRARSLE